MSLLVFDGVFLCLTLLDKNRRPVGSWAANNVTDSQHSKIIYIPDGAHAFLVHKRPTKHPGKTEASGIAQDSKNGRYGPYGSLTLGPVPVDGVDQTGLAVHSGRANYKGADEATNGCIRTTDEAMRVITTLMETDPLEHLIVRRNRNQRGKTNIEHHVRFLS